MSLPEEWFITEGPVNAVIAWFVTALLVAVAVDNLLAVRLVDVVLAGVAVAVAIVPALHTRRWKTTIPWPLLLFASVPLVLGAARPSFFDLFVTGIGLAALGMLAVVALELTTSVSMTPGFAIVFVVLATLAFAGVWAVGSAAAAVLVGTSFVRTNAELMRIFTAALLGGLVGGLVFRWYFHRQRARTAGPAPVDPEEAK